MKRKRVTAFAPLIVKIKYFPIHLRKKISRGYYKLSSHELQINSSASFNNFTSVSIQPTATVILYNTENKAYSFRTSPDF